MNKRSARGRAALRLTAFFLLGALLLEGFSLLSREMGRDRAALRNYSTTSFFAEPRDTIDVLAIGTSSVYSSVAPMEWWNRYGFTGYTWGEPSQRIFETYEYLKKIYRTQRPAVVFLEVGALYRDTTRAQVLDSLVKSRLEQAVPLIAYHRNLDPRKLRNLGAPRHSVTKGFFPRAGTVQSDSLSDYMKAEKSTVPMDPLCSGELRRCVRLCHRHGSQVVLLSVPDRSSWNGSRHDAVERLAEAWGVPYLDLNLELREEINWRTDTVDGGIHLNCAGAGKVTAYLGSYLSSRYRLPDHRGDAAYSAWNRDWKKFSGVLSAAERPVSSAA
ncbi:MAG: SGNH/GDSL hydrolase family protein [Oscillibacter sp.]|jgi:hypothetical protein|nr:SGNH/GDSL hydrolase family protein [Oscillibacter sp.]